MVIMLAVIKPAVRAFALIALADFDKSVSHQSETEDGWELLISAHDQAMAEIEMGLWDFVARRGF